jgi:signal peptidase I
MHLGTPQRQDVVVFKYPKEPQRNYEQVNYIKRLIGRPGETIAIYRGDLYVYPDPQAPPLTYEDRPRPQRPEDLRKREYMYENDPKALDLFEHGKFAIIRKSPEKVLALRRLVYDNDHPPKDLVQLHYPARWAPEKGEATPAANAAAGLAYRERRRLGEKESHWLPDKTHGFRHAARSGDLAWLRYRHLVVPRSAHSNLAGGDQVEIKPQLITDFLGYNTGQLISGMHSPRSTNWVGDLILECDVTIEKADGQFVLELNKGPDRFQARWDLTSGECTLLRWVGGKEEKLASRPTLLKAKGTYRLRFADVDERLIVWVGRQLPFGDGVAYTESPSQDPTEDDLLPAGIGAHGGALSVHKLQLWRDTYYTVDPGRSDARDEVQDWSSPASWSPLRELPAKTLYVQPGCYLCLGDNSPESADSREWGLVPDRLMLGRALLVYWPFFRVGPIH